MRICRWTVAAILLCFALVVTAAPRTEHVFIISIDGGSPEVVHRAEMPVLKRLAQEGACTWNAQTIKPSITLPAHTSMLTGVTAEKHHITWNNWEPTNGVVTVPTIFTNAKYAGLSTAMFVGKEKFRHLLQPDTVDKFDYDEPFAIFVMKSADGSMAKEKEGNVMAKVVATNAAHYIVEHKPNLCFIHFTDPDTIGHEFGWGSPEQIKAFGDVDAALGLVMTAIHEAHIAERSVVIISADHGGHDKGHSKAEPIDMTIPWIAWGQGVRKHFEISAPVNTCDTAATALWLLQIDPLHSLDGAPVTSAFAEPVGHRSSADAAGN